MINDTEKYYKLWCENCDLFFEYMKTNFPNIKIILNTARLSGIMKKSDGTKYINEEFYKRAEIANPLINRLDEHIIKKYDVDILYFDSDEFNSRENHPWSESPNHYAENYYSNITKQLLSIIKSCESEKKPN